MPLPLKQARDALLDQVRMWQRSGYPPNDTRHTIACLSTPVLHTDALLWLRVQRGQPKIFWSERERYEVFAGFGTAWNVTAQGPVAYREAMQEVHSLLEDAAPEVRFWGGCRFDAASRVAEEWRKWPAACFVLPRIALCENGTGCYLMGFIPRFSTADEHAALDALGTSLAQLLDTPPDEGTMPKAAHQRCHDVVGKKQWRDALSLALEGIRGRSLQKVVMARAVDVTLTHSTPPLELLQSLRKTVPQAFHFSFQVDDSNGFLGATPELLYHRRGYEIASEALSGTTSRGGDTHEDASLAEALKSDDKECREHLSVLEYLEATLQPLCTRLERVALMECLMLPKVQHLRSRVQGTLRAEVGDVDLLCALHPTPAVAGLPKALARVFIKQIEPFDRGWYTGPVGWVSGAETQFAVALRCGLLANDNLRVYAGAGIVAGSEALREWHETEMKLSNWTTLLQPI